MPVSRSSPAIAAAPAPEQTSRISSSLRPVSSSQLTRAARGHHGGAVLVVVEHRDVHALDQLRLDLEALGRLDVLEIDAAEGGFQPGDGLHEGVDVGLGDLDIEHVRCRRSA